MAATFKPTGTFLHEHCGVYIQISLKFVPQGFNVQYASKHWFRQWLCAKQVTWHCVN